MSLPYCSSTLLKGYITDAEIGTLASPTRSHFSQQLGNDHVVSISRFAAFLLVLVQPSSQYPRREPKSDDSRQECRQVVGNRLVVPSLASGVAVRNRRNACWYARFGFSSWSVATVWEPSGGPRLSPKSDMPWRHQPGHFACGRSSGRASSMATQLHTA